MFAGKPEPRCRCALRHADERGNLPAAETLELEQHEHGAQLVWQRIQRLVEQGSSAALLERALRIQIAALEVQRLVRSVSAQGKPLSPPLLRGDQDGSFEQEGALSP